MEELRIEGSPEDLEDLRRYLLANLGDEIELDEFASSGTGELREPILISLVVALGGPVVVKSFVDVVKAWFAHREKMTELDMKFSLLRDQPMPVTLDELATEGARS